jgi:hypothetical protein
MPSPGSLRRLRPQAGRPHTIDECDRELERLADLARTNKPTIRADAMRRADIWLEERLRAMRGHRRH